MPRPTKQGIDFFPTDINLFEDDRIFLLEEKYGDEGIAYLFKLFINIYRNSYFLDWGEITHNKFCRNMRLNKERSTELLNFLIEIGIINRDKFEAYSILTSEGIQERWLRAVKRRVMVIMCVDHLLLSSELIEKTKVAGLVIVDGKGEAIAPLKKSKAAAAAPKAAAKKNKADHDRDFILEFISVPYQQRAEAFQKMYSKDWYESYCRFYGELVTKYPSLMVSDFQITIYQYVKLHTELKFDQPTMYKVLDKMAGSGTQASSDMDKRFRQFLGYVLEDEAKTKKTTPQKAKDVVLYDQTQAG